MDKWQGEVEAMGVRTRRSEDQQAILKVHMEELVRREKIAIARAQSMESLARAEAAARQEAVDEVLKHEKMARQAWSRSGRPSASQQNQKGRLAQWPDTSAMRPWH